MTTTPPTPTTGSGADVRVRFCPSPTGNPHVGLVRTCLFNWAYARHTGGTFVFRIEDTDAARDSEESYHQLLDSLRWLGLDWDEGVEVGGPHEPYRQSQRRDIYARVIAELLEGGYAYESFSTPEEVEARHLAAGRDAKSGYDNHDRTLSEEQKATFRAEGREPVIRMRMPDRDITFTDVVRGEITFAAGSVPDYAIARAGGAALYPLTNPVDDALMGITHVLRGEDLLSSTPRQIVLHEALVELGHEDAVPVFGHLPYVMGEGNKKLSKRDPESNLLLHRDNGMIPEGLLNYLGLLGWSISADRDLFDREEMIAAFDVADVNPSPARFDLAKCTAINAEHIRMLDPADLARRLVPFLHREELVGADAWEGLSEREREILTEATPLVQPRLQLLGEAPAKLRFLLVDAADLEVDEAAAGKLKGEVPAILDATITALEAVPADGFTPEAVEAALKAGLVEGGLELKPRVAFAPPRVAISGSNVSPPLYESMAILGREEVLARLAAFRATR